MRRQSPSPPTRLLAVLPCPLISALVDAGEQRAYDRPVRMPMSLFLCFEVLQHAGGGGSTSSDGHRRQRRSTSAQLLRPTAWLPALTSLPLNYNSLLLPKQMVASNPLFALVSAVLFACQSVESVAAQQRPFAAAQVGSPAAPEQPRTLSSDGLATFASIDGDSFTALYHREFPDHRVRIKETTGYCDPSVRCVRAGRTEAIVTAATRATELTPSQS
jgi:hypothetical protein